MSDLVIGMGQIGTAVKEVTESEYSFDSAKTPWVDFGEVEVLHICIPYSEDFVPVVKAYIELVKPQHVAIWSTVPIGTCGMIDQKVVHTPVEGKHPDLELSIRFMERWIGANDIEEGQWFAHYFAKLGIRSKIVSRSRFTEALKLISTTEYGINIAFADYKKHIAADLEMPYELTKQWNEEYNKLYRNLGLDKKFQKFVLDAPDGVCGGHCVKPNAAILARQYPSQFADLIVAMGDPE